jgi:hypothetical protein
MVLENTRKLQGIFPKKTKKKKLWAAGHLAIE